MIWEDKKIRQYCEHRGMVIPYEPSLINPASIDLRLGNELRKAGSHGWMDPIEFEEYVLGPGEFVLCHSLEYVQIPVTAAAILILKSSMGRNGLNHSHSGWGDPGFGLGKGAQWTFEFQNIAPWPIMLKAGQRVIQMILVDLCNPPLQDYRETGHYVYQEGPTLSVTGE